MHYVYNALKKELLKYINSNNNNNNNNNDNNNGYQLGK